MKLQLLSSTSTSLSSSSRCAGAAGSIPLEICVELGEMSCVHSTSGAGGAVEGCRSRLNLY